LGRGGTRRTSRLVRLLAGRNTLRRPVDRIEGAALVALSAAFLVAVAVASIFGTHTYQLQRAAAAACGRLIEVYPSREPEFIVTLTGRSPAWP